MRIFNSNVKSMLQRYGNQMPDEEHYQYHPPPPLINSGHKLK